MFNTHYNTTNYYSHPVNTLLNGYANAIRFMMLAGDDISREEDRLCMLEDIRCHCAHQWGNFFYMHRVPCFDVHQSIDAMSAANKQAIHQQAVKERMKRM